jgi:hypothetical protein
VQHLERQHPNKWKEYRKVLPNGCANEVEKFLDNEEVGFVIKIHAFVDPGVQMRFSSSTNILYTPSLGAGCLNRIGR